METISQAIKENRIGDNGLPLWCFAEHPTTGESVIVDYPKHGYTALEIAIPWPKAQTKNREMGVTREMEKAMLIGSMFGFHVPGAQVDD